MTPLAIIPARAGSKRLADKNRQEIAGFTLVETAVAHANMAGLFQHRIVVTTEDATLLPSPERMAANFWWVGVPRPSVLAEDATTMMEVVRHAVRYARDALRMEFDVVVLLQPTSPLRRPQDIIDALALMERGNADAVISVTPTRYPEVYTIGDINRLRPVEVDNAYGRPLVVPNGAIYAITTKALDLRFDWWSAQMVYAYEMPASRSVDIDTEADLQLARKLWTEQS